MDFARSGYDRSGRPPRRPQKAFLSALEKEWDNYDVFAGTAPTGAGKTLIARSIQIAVPKTRIVTVSNGLVRQCGAAYPEVLPYMGASNYATREEYFDARLMASDPSTDICTNPIALFYLKKTCPIFEDSDCIVIDEADAVFGLLSTLTLRKIRVGEKDYKVHNLQDPRHLGMFLRQKAQHHRDVFTEMLENVRVRSVRSLASHESKAQKYDILAEMLSEGDHRVSIQWSVENGLRFLTVQPIRLPIQLFKSIFGVKKVVLLSATLFDTDLFEALPTDRIKRFEVESPIPPEQRPFVFMPAGIESWYPTPHEELALAIDKALEKFKHLRPALVHVTYQDAAELSKYLKTPHMMYSDRDEKPEVLEKWLKEGGVLLGAGVSTGLDLKDDLCRLNIISRIVYPSLGSDYVKKRKALSGKWYKIAAVRQVIQASGRATRGAKDYSLTLMLDDRWPSLRLSVQDDLPEFFKDVIDGRTHQL